MTNETPTLKIASHALSAEIATLGAELGKLSDASGRLLQWDGDPAIWAGRAPILFPIVGELRDGRYRVDGRTYALPRHGFARRSTFDVVSHADDSAVLGLRANDETRKVYPFDFELQLAYTLSGAALRVVATISNHGSKPMPASVGFHPAFAWPLPFGQARADHFIRFERDEPAPVRRLDPHGLLLAEARPSPVVGDVLALRDDLFVDDALIFDALTSRRVSYGASAGPRLDIDFEDFPMLGVWNKPGAEFVCIEPWQGVTDPVGFDGELSDKTGIIVVEAGRSRAFTMTITLNDALNELSVR
jgi:galactose mutarotase-like enzyme